MERKSLHPSVEQFKEFIQKHPGLIKNVRNEEYTWQELYEDWYLLGEDDPKWANYQGKEGVGTEENQSDSKLSLNQITKIFKNMDINQVQGHIQQLSQAIGAIQGVIGQFQGQESQKASSQPQTNNHPFSFRKD
ncbi:YlbD family protein [Bacillus niameyensis]|uniref:YlbD family protein n=1 Tax=Bacillus niameyensis TaxID=1522308 RepID=UPI000783C109|nr:YlbD family protein [Bacillus niameyensis]